MNGRDLVRAVRTLGPAGGLRVARAAWRRRRADAAGLPPRGAERARVPGPASGAEPLPGGGTVRFARSELRIVVTVGGAVFRGWDGAMPEPSYALAGAPPAPDPRAGLEPDKDGGWRVVSERLTVAVSRHGAVEIRTPGGVVLRRDLPPRWWEPVGGGPARWVQRSEIPADARVFGLGGHDRGPRLRTGTYRLWNGTGPGVSGAGGTAAHITMPVQMAVADAGTHLTFHDNTWDGSLTVREGEEGAGSGHDRPGSLELRMAGGPLRSWVLVGTPPRVLTGWTRLTGAPALPADWALGTQTVLRAAGEEEVRRTVAGYRERGLPLSAVHVGPDDTPAGPGGDPDRFPGLPELAKDLRADGVRLVRAMEPVVGAVAGSPLYEDGSAAGLFVREAGGAEVRGTAGPGECVFPDFTDGRVREWWGALYEEGPAQEFSGVWHDRDWPASCTAFEGATLPRSSRHWLEGRGGDHREAHNVYALAMARAGYEAQRRLRPDERPFVVSRSGWAGMQRYGGAWAPGDTGRGWRGLRASLSLVLGLGLCGVPYAGTDVPGDDGGRSAELYLRGLQLAAYLPLLRTTASGAPWAYGPEVAAHAAAVLAERERLGPYLLTLGQVARLTGAPYVRPLWWRSTQDRRLRDCEDAFLLGDALLVAPVLEAAADRRAVRLPRGRWYDTATGQPYEGPGQVHVQAPLSRIPVLARAGAVIPVLGAGRPWDGEGGQRAAAGIELEVWAPAAGRRGGGLVVRDAGDGWAEPAVERYTTRLVKGRVTVERVTDDGPVAVGTPVRVRGLS